MLATDACCQLSLAYIAADYSDRSNARQLHGLVPAPTAGASVGIESWRP